MTIALDARRRVFIKGLNWVGDAILATPMLRQLRRTFAGSHVTLMVRPWVAAIYEHSPDIDELWIADDSASWGEFLSAARRVRDGRFDFGVALPNSFRSALLLALGRVKHRVGFRRGGRSLFLTHPIALPAELLKQHQVHYYMRLIEWAIDGKPDPPKLVLRAGEKERGEIVAMLREFGVEPDAPRIGIAPGSINSAAKRWLPERFAAVADRLHDEGRGRVFLLGSAAERDVAGEVERHCRTPVINTAGRMSLGRMIAFMEGAKAFVGNDAGAMHVAAALGVPTVAVFGPTEWMTTAPFSRAARIVREPVDCSPCMLRECPIDHRCMTRVQVDDVMKALGELRAAG